MELLTKMQPELSLIPPQTNSMKGNLLVVTSRQIALQSTANPETWNQISSRRLFKIRIWWLHYRMFFSRSIFDQKSVQCNFLLFILQHLRFYKALSLFHVQGQDLLNVMIQVWIVPDLIPLYLRIVRAPTYLSHVHISHHCLSPIDTTQCKDVMYPLGAYLHAVWSVCGAAVPLFFLTEVMSANVLLPMVLYIFIHEILVTKRKDVTINKWQINPVPYRCIILWHATLQCFLIHTATHQW